MKSVSRFLFLLAFVFSASYANAEILRMAVTTSFENSGLSDVLLPEIKSDLGIDLQLVVVGTGQAIKLGEAGDVDAILVHSKSAEEKFIAEAYGTHRREIMYNDFVIIGPNDDPVRIGQAKTIADAMNAIEQRKAVFVSRGDDSGTHRKELSLWKAARLDAVNFDDGWYKSVGSGMGAALNTASGMNAYIMSDRASWSNFKNKGQLKILFSGDPVLFNQYAYLPVNPAKHSHVRNDLAKKLEDWLVSEKGQKLIGSYSISGEKLFTPNAKP